MAERCFSVVDHNNAISFALAVSSSPRPPVASWSDLVPVPSSRHCEVTMAVRDLVSLFETRPTDKRPSPHASGSQHANEAGSPQPEQQVLASSPDFEPTRQAKGRLSPHPLLRRREPSHTEETDDVTIPSGSAELLNDTSAASESLERVRHPREVSADVTDELVSVAARSTGASGRYESSVPAWDAMGKSLGGVEVDQLSFPHGADTSAYASTSTIYTPGPSYPPVSALFSGQTGVHRNPGSSSTTLIPLVQKAPAHNPIPLSTIFSRKAVPLSLPKLDDYIARLPAASFPSLADDAKGKSKAPAAVMFPPMDQLAASKKSLADLEHNATIPPGWRNCGAILSNLISIVLGITVCFLFYISISMPNGPYPRARVH